jgi:5-amino-6-(5-phosphoribosylamino)uracil reductase
MLLPGSAVVGELSSDTSGGGDGDGEVLQAVADLYAYPVPVPATGWVRANMVTTLDGSAVAADGVTAGISDAVDKAVFAVLRALSDVVLVGAGTVRAEGYGPPRVRPAFAERRERAGQSPAPVLAVVTRTGDVPAGTGLFAHGAGTLLVVPAAADLTAARRLAGADNVVVAGEQDVDPAAAVAELAGRGLRRILLEGGPTLLGRTVAAGRLDELCLTVSPLLAAGDGPRIAFGDQAHQRLRPAHLLESGGMLLGRWLVVREEPSSV